MFDNPEQPEYKDHEYCPFNNNYIRCLKNKCMFFNIEKKECKILKCVDKYLNEK